MTDPEDLRRALVAAAAAGAGGTPEPPADGPAAALRRMSRAVARLLHADGAVVTGTPDDGVAVATDPLAARLAELEEVVGDGPAVRAPGAGQSVTVLLGAPWPSGVPALDAAAAEAGLPAVTVRAWPVRSRGRAVGVLLLHTTLPPAPVPTPRWPGGGDAEPHGVALVPEADGQLLADALAPALLALLCDERDRPAHVDRAVGMVVAQTGLPPEDARALLRARAWADGQRLTDTAAAVLDRRTRLAGPGTGRGTDRPGGTGRTDPDDDGGDDGRPGTAPA